MARSSSACHGAMSSVQRTMRAYEDGAGGGQGRFWRHLARA
jgi:hypothetical protein